jgi:hypothetical protein
MIRNPLAQLVLASALSFFCLPTFGAPVNASFTVSSAQIVDLYSATFDGALTPCNGSEPDPDECTFFSGDQTTNTRAISVASAPASNASGTFNVTYDSVTGEISQVNSMLINLPDAVLTIAGTTVVTVTQGNATPAANDTLFIESGTGTLGRDLDGAGPATALGQGTADADQIRALIGAGTGLFEHAEPGAIPDAPDFSVFNDIVDNCTGDLCALIGILSLDGVRYRLLGTTTAAGGSFQLQTQTANNSIYKVNFTTVVPEPAAVWLFGSALGLLGWIRSRARA